MTIVYYHIHEGDEGPEIAVTSKDYFDANGCLDDGGGVQYEAIAAAMAMCGCEETCESVFDMSETTIDELKPKMAELNYDMQMDENFTAFLSN